MNNTITIVTPSLNQGQFIERAIKSVLAQEGNFYIDYIIADGGSTDQSVEIIKRYDHLLKNQKYPIKCRDIDFKWWSRKDKGQSNALNQGFKIARGDILGWLNCDDYYEPGALEFIFRKFKENPDVNLIYGDSYNIIQPNPEKNIMKFKQVNFDELLSTAYALNQPSVFFTRAIINKVGLLDESLRYVMDFDLWLRIAKISKILHVSRVLATYELWSGCKGVCDKEKFGPETRKVCRRYDKNPLSKRNVSMFLAQFRFARYLKIKTPKFYQWCKKRFFSFYQ